MTTGKNIALTIWTFVGKVISLLLKMLSRLVITLLPRSKRLLISWLQLPSKVILEPRKIVSHCVPIYLPWSDGTTCHDLRFLNVKEKLKHCFWNLTFLSWKKACLTTICSSLTASIKPSEWEGNKFCSIYYVFSYFMYIVMFNIAPLNIINLFYRWR